MPTPTFETIETDGLIVGAGVIGLAIASKLSLRSSNLVLVETHSKFGQETSSRNSEVIHSGIYYPRESFKTKWCIEGRELLYSFCEKHQVPFRKVAKVLVATRPEEEGYLETRYLHAKSLNVPVEKISREKINSKEPLLKANSALFFSESGIVDSHSLMAHFENDFIGRGGFIAYRHRVTQIEKVNGCWQINVEGPSGEILVKANWVINAAGLYADQLSNQAELTSRYEHRFCRGRYFSLAPFNGKFSHLIYPVPPKDGLGVHITLDLENSARIGPDVEWCEVKHHELDSLYDCNWDSIKGNFLQAVNRYCEGVKAEDLKPALIGIRPKLFIDNKAHTDFLVENYGGFVHCLGIESPGLTSSLAIANHVDKLLF